MLNENKIYELSDDELENVNGGTGANGIDFGVDDWVVVAKSSGGMSRTYYHVLSIDGSHFDGVMYKHSSNNLVVCLGNKTGVAASGCKKVEKPNWA